MPRAAPIPPQPGQESVWDYPRPPRLERVAREICIVFGGRTIARATHAQRVLETSHPPVYYLPPDAVRSEYLVTEGARSFCEWKGGAVYYSLVVDDRRAERVAWSYPDPVPAFAGIKDWLAFYAGPMDSCTVGGQEVTPQPGGFYGGWITPDIVGPFKGEPGTMGW